MEKTLNELIAKYRAGDNEQFILISEKFKPAILKYAKYLYKDEAEDTMSALNLSLMEAVSNIKYFNDEGQCCIFLMKALHNKYLELYKKSRKKFDHEQPLSPDYEVCISYDEYEQIEWMNVFETLLSGYNKLQKSVLISIFIKGYSVAEAASQHHISRQYASRIKSKFCRELKMICAA